MKNGSKETFGERLTLSGNLSMRPIKTWSWTLMYGYPLLKNIWAKIMQEPRY